MDSESEFESVRTDPDPIRRGQRASSLLMLYQQRATELARLRKAAIEEAHRERGLSYTEIAAALGITKGRVTQIRSSAPPRERAFFGVGPVSVGVPYRYQTTDRERPLIAAEDAQTGEELERLLNSLTLAVTRYQIEPDREEPPAGDSVVVCGPKSAPVGADLMSRDPMLGMAEADGRWWIEHRPTGKRYGSPSDEPDPRSADVAYVARHHEEGRVIVHIAGIHGIGSLGATHYLTAHLAEVFGQVGEKSCSLAVRATYEGLTITGSELAAGPYVW
jgi:transcriptional regulator with XRE-family HTH domain